MTFYEGDTKINSQLIHLYFVLSLSEIDYTIIDKSEKMLPNNGAAVSSKHTKKQKMCADTIFVSPKVRYWLFQKLEYTVLLTYINLSS